MAGTLDQSNTTAQTDGRGIHYDTGYHKVGVGFRCGLTGNLVEGHLYVGKLGTPLSTAHLWAQIYTNNTDRPNTTQVGGNSDSLHTTDVVDDWAAVTELTFSWSSNYPALTSGTDYWLVIDTDIDYSTSNYFGLSENASPTSNQQADCKSSNIDVWTPIANVYGRFKTYMASSATTSTSSSTVTTSTSTTTTSKSTSTTTTSKSTSTSTTTTSISTSSSTSTTTTSTSLSTSTTTTSISTSSSTSTTTSVSTSTTTTLMIDQIYDDFNDNSLDTTKWRYLIAASDVTETGQRLQINQGGDVSPRGIITKYRYNATGKSVYTELSLLTTQENTQFNFGLADPFLTDSTFDNVKGAWWNVSDAGYIKGLWNDGTGYQIPVGQTTYIPATYRWVRIREASGTLYWEYSSDAVNWNSAGSYTVGNLPITNIWAGYWAESNNDAPDEPDIVDNFNTYTTTSTSTSTSSSTTTTSVSTSTTTTSTSSSTSTSTTTTSKSTSTSTTTTSISTSTSTTTTSKSTSTSTTTTSRSTSTSTTTTSTSSSTSTSTTTTSRSTSSSTSTTTTSTSSSTSTSTTTTSKSTSTSTTTTSTSTSTSTSTTTTSQSTSTSTTMSNTTTTSTSTSTSTTTTSTSTTTTTILSSSGGLAFGEQNPTNGELAVSWATWSGTGAVIGNVDWGKYTLDETEYGSSLVYDFGNTNDRTIALVENLYGVGQGSATLRIRGQNTSFLVDDVDPTWEDYTIPVNKTWKYIQVGVVVSLGGQG